MPFTGADNGGLIEQTSRPDPALAEQFAAPAAQIYESREGARQAILPDSGLSSHSVSGESSDCVPGPGIAETPAEVSGDTRETRAGRLACATDYFDLDCDGVTGDSNPGNEGSILSLGCIDMFMVQDNNRCLRAIFDVVAASGQFNFRAARIPLPSALRLSRWRRHMPPVWPPLFGHGDAAGVAGHSAICTHGEVISLGRILMTSGEWSRASLGLRLRSRPSRPSWGTSVSSRPNPRFACPLKS